MLSNESIAKFLQAIQRTPHFKWIESQMAKQDAAQGEHDATDAMAIRVAGQAEKYQASLAAEAVRIHTASVRAGRGGLTWDEARAAAVKRLGPAPQPRKYAAPRRPSPERYAARVTDEAVRLHMLEVNAGRPGLTWERARQLAIESLA